MRPALADAKRLTGVAARVLVPAALAMLAIGLLFDASQSALGLLDRKSCQCLECLVEQLVRHMHRSGRTDLYKLHQSEVHRDGLLAGALNSDFRVAVGIVSRPLSARALCDVAHVMFSIGL